MLTLSDKLCTIANGNRSGHDLRYSTELFIEANFVHSNYGVHWWGFRKKYNQKKIKIGKSIWSKTTSKIV